VSLQGKGDPTPGPIYAVYGRNWQNYISS